MLLPLRDALRLRARIHIVLQCCDQNVVPCQSTPSVLSQHSLFAGASKLLYNYIIIYMYIVSTISQSIGSAAIMLRMVGLGA